MAHHRNTSHTRAPLVIILSQSDFASTLVPWAATKKDLPQMPEPHLSSNSETPLPGKSEPNNINRHHGRKARLSHAKDVSPSLCYKNTTTRREVSVCLIRPSPTCNRGSGILFAVVVVIICVLVDVLFWLLGGCEASHSV